MGNTHHHYHNDGSSDSAELKKVKEAREQAEARHQQTIALIKEQLADSRQQRNEALEAVKRLEVTLQEERERSTKEIERLKADQATLMEEVRKMMKKFEEQEAKYAAQLAQAQADNQKLSAQIMDLLEQMRVANEKHNQVLAENQAKHEEIVNKLLNQGSSLVDEIRKLRGDNDRARNATVTASGNLSPDQVEEDIRQESRAQEAALQRAICRAGRMLDATVKFEVRSIADLLKDQPMVGPILAGIVRRETEKRASAGTVMPACGSYGDFLLPPRPFLDATAVPSIA